MQYVFCNYQGSIKTFTECFQLNNNFIIYYYSYVILSLFKLIYLRIFCYRKKLTFQNAANKREYEKMFSVMTWRLKCKFL